METAQPKKERHCLLSPQRESVSFVRSCLQLSLMYSQGRRENYSTNAGSSGCWLINVGAPSDFFHPLQLLVPSPQLVHLPSGPRANAAGEGGVMSALHLVTTQQWEAVHFNKSTFSNFIHKILHFFVCTDAYNTLYASCENPLGTYTVVSCNSRNKNEQTPQTVVVSDTYLLASSFFRQDLKEVARSTAL